jgi:LAS superfamily LD-carboxypeptidase LdcB
MKFGPLQYLIILAIVSCGISVTDKPSEVSNAANETKASNEILVSTESISDRDSLITKEFLLGKFDYRKHELFVRVPRELSSKELYIQQEALDAFSKMYDSAALEKIELKIVSGTRNFEEQKRIWETKWQKERANFQTPKETALKILEYSSMPSTSRHHWGTDIDINSVESAYFKSEKGAAEYSWLLKNANRFGFFQTYTSKENGRTGYSMEEWHWSYFPLAENYLDRYNELIVSSDINGFMGCETANEIDIIKNYVNGIEGK